MLPAPPPHHGHHGMPMPPLMPMPHPPPIHGYGGMPPMYGMPQMPPPPVFQQQYHQVRLARLRLVSAGCEPHLRRRGRGGVCPCCFCAPVCICAPGGCSWPSCCRSRKSWRFSPILPASPPLRSLGWTPLCLRCADTPSPGPKRLSAHVNASSALCALSVFRRIFIVCLHYTHLSLST